VLRLQAVVNQALIQRVLPVDEEGIQVHPGATLLAAIAFSRRLTSTIRRLSGRKSKKRRETGRILRILHLWVRGSSAWSQARMRSWLVAAFRRSPARRPPAQIVDANHAEDLCRALGHDGGGAVEDAGASVAVNTLVVDVVAA
jgi:hypothetical protein